MKIPQGPFACPASGEYDEVKSSSHYGINSWIRATAGGYSSAWWPGGAIVKIYNIKSPSLRAGMFDVDRWLGYDNPPPAAEDRAGMVSDEGGKPGKWRHSNKEGINVCFADGHVEMRTKDSIPTEADYQESEDEESYEEGYFWGTKKGD